jgi:hypothetical protein
MGIPAQAALHHGMMSSLAPPQPASRMSVAPPLPLG